MLILNSICNTIYNIGCLYLIYLYVQNDFLNKRKQVIDLLWLRLHTMLIYGHASILGGPTVY